MTESLTVRYSGGSSGRGRMTLGQDNMIRCIRQDDPSHMNKQAVWPVPEGADLPAVLDALRALAERHAALRTVFSEAHQILRGEGEFNVSVVEVEAGEDVDAVALELGRLGRAQAFDLAAEFPLRPTVLVQDGRPVRLLVVVCHAQLDGVATGMLFLEWLELAAGRTLAPPAGRTPLEVAEQEGSRTGLRKAEASLRHWERILRDEPQAVFADDRVGVSDALLPTLVVQSVSAAKALDRAAQRTGAGATNVLLAAYAALVGHRADQRTVVVAALSANRHRPGLADHIGTLAQDALLSLKVDAADFDELIGRTKAAAFAGYWHSTFDAEKIWRLIDDTGHQRGARHARHVVVNDLSPTLPDAALASLPLPVSDPELSWQPPEITPTRIMLNIWRLRDCLAFTLHADPQLFTVAETEQFASALLQLVTLAADGPVPLGDLTGLTGIHPGTRSRLGWQRIDNNWIDLAAVEALFDHPVELTLTDGRLTARVTAPHLTPEGAHSAIMAALPGHDTAMAPHWYVIREGERVVAEGSGRGE